MRLATWNVNSIRTRVGRVIDYLERSETDVLAMQELKCRPDQFPFEAFEEAGYEVAAHGLDQWNGVAVASRLPMDGVLTSFDAQPAFGDPAVVEARALRATIRVPLRGGGFSPLDVWSLYVPNGREIDHPHYAYKLAWLEALRRDVTAALTVAPRSLTALVGDWNVARRDVDVWDMAAFEGATHVTEPERAALRAFEADGWREVTSDLVEGYTYWDYQKLRFPRDEGMRIDWVYASPALAECVRGAFIDRDERKGKGASDHVPVLVDLDLG